MINTEELKNTTEIKMIFSEYEDIVSVDDVMKMLHKKWIVDPEAAAIVKDIFKMCLEGTRVGVEMEYIPAKSA